MIGRRPAGAVAAGLLAIVLGACSAAPAPPPTGAGSPPPSAEEPSLTLPPGGPSTAPSETAPVASVDAPALAGAALTCGDPGSTFPAAILDQPANAELGPGPAADALRQYVRQPDVVATDWPTTGWRVVESAPERATFLGSGGAAPFWWIATFQPQDGQWQFSEGGACQLAVDLPDDVSFASWRLDPATPPKADSTTVHVLGTEASCANGDPPVGRVLAPVVLPTADAVTIALLVRKVPGGADCPGNPEFPQEVTLPDPLGTRQLFDGSTVPPTPRS